MPPVFLPQAQPVYPNNADFSKQLALLGDTIGQAYQGYQKKSLLSDVAASLQSGDVAGAANSLIKSGDLTSGLALIKMQQQQQAGADFERSMSGVFGGQPPAAVAPPQSAPQPSVLQPAQPQTLLPRPPVPSTSRVWGDNEAEAAGLYPPAANTATPKPAPEIPTPVISPMAMAQAGISDGAMINGVPLRTALPGLIKAAVNPNLPKQSQELARGLLMKAVETNPEITKLEIFQKRPDLLKTEMDLKRAGATTINTAEGMDAAQAKARIAVDTHAVSDLSKKVVSGRAAIPILDRMIEINDKTPGGWAGQASPTVAKTLATLGLPIPENVSNSELMVALSRQFIPSVRDPGSTSNYEQSLYSQAVPGLAQSQPGRIQIASMMKAQVKRNADIMAIYRNNMGSPDLDKKLAELDNTPIFTPQQKTALEKEVARLSGGSDNPAPPPPGRTKTGVPFRILQ